MEITREVTLDAPAADVWEALTDDDVRSDWLEDDADRVTLVDTADPGRLLRWTWWDDGGAASTVTITLTPTDDGGTHLHVAERLVLPPVTAHVPSGRAEASAREHAWDHRILGIELLLLDLAVLV